jgi:hypothetical protein
VAAGSLPANLKIVTLGASGSGSVDEDNSGEIASRLFDAAGRSLGLPEPPPPQHGLVIGGSQRLAPPYAPTQTVQGERVRRDSGGDACAVPSVRGDEGSALAAAWPLVCVILALRRLRRRGDAAR